MTFVRTIRCLRASLLALFVVAQVAGVVPLIYDHTLNVYETAPVAAHGHAHVKPTVANPDRQPPTPGGEPDKLRSPHGTSPRGPLSAAGPVGLRHLRAPPGCALYRQWRPLPDLSMQLEASGSSVTKGLYECGLQAARRCHC